MSIFYEILQRLALLYSLIALGYISGRVLGVRKESVALLLIYVIGPIFFLHMLLGMQLDKGRLSLPVVFYAISTLLGSSLFVMSKASLGTPRRNLLALAGGTANMGYFGIPVASIVLGESVLGVMVLVTLGLAIFGNTLGFFMAAMGRSSVRQSLRRTLTLPSAYVALLGIGANLAGYRPGPLIMQFGAQFKGAYTVLGMMIIGFALGDQPRIKVDRKFIAWCLGGKFLAWPAAMLTLILLDRTWFHFYDPALYRVMALLSLVPLASDTASVASLLDIEADRMATAILFSTFISLLLIPLMLPLILAL